MDLEIEAMFTDDRMRDFGGLTFGSDGAAGMDLRAVLERSLVLVPNTRPTLIGTGIAIHIEDARYAAFILPRSGLGHKKGLVLGNLVGLIDSDYTGELKMSLWNRSQENIKIEPFERVAQLMIVPVVRPTVKWVDSFTERSIRGANGFGSSGK